MCACLQAKMWYVLKYEYGYKLGDCLTFCDKDAECPDLKAQGNISERVDLNNYMNFQVCLNFIKCIMYPNQFTV